MNIQDERRFWLYVAWVSLILSVVFIWSAANTTVGDVIQTWYTEILWMLTAPMTVIGPFVFLLALVKLVFLRYR